MKNILILFTLFLMFPPEGGHKMVVKVTGLRPLSGELYVALHNRPDYFSEGDSAFMKKKIAITSPTENIVFNQVPDGKYAIAVYHDENLDGKLDENELGIPKEGYGFSGEKRMFGKPKFDMAAFDFNNNDTIRVEMIYRGENGRN